MKAQEAKEFANKVKEAIRKNLGRSAWERGVFEWAGINPDEDDEEE